MPLPYLPPGAHFLCDTLDITRPFPSYRAIKEPSWDLVWNRWLSTPFRNLGLDHLCPPLLQVQWLKHANPVQAVLKGNRVSGSAKGPCGLVSTHRIKLSLSV